MGHQGAIVWQAYLPAVSMAAQIELDPGSIRLVGHFGGMHQGNTKTRTPATQRCRRRSSVKVVHIIKSDENDALAVSLDRCRAMDQHLEVCRLEGFGHFNRSVITKYGETPSADSDTGEELAQRFDRALQRIIGNSKNIARMDQQIDHEPVKHLSCNHGEFGYRIQMRVGEVENPEAIERLRQLRECKVQ